MLRLDEDDWVELNLGEDNSITFNWAKTDKVHDANLILM